MTKPPPPPPPPEGGFPPPEGGYPPPQGGYPPPQGGYPPPPQGFYPPPQGFYPPPQSGYPPPQGAYPPPPQGGYPPPQGSYPPPQGFYPPPQGGHQAVGGPGYGASPEVNIGEGLSWAWNKFSKNAVPLLVATLVYGAILIAIQVVEQLVSYLVAPSATYDSYDGGVSVGYSVTGVASLLVLFFGSLVTIVAAGAISSAYLGGILDIANGQPVQIGSFFKPRNVGSVLISSLIVGIAVSIGSFLCVIPGLVVAIFTIFTTVLIIERNLAPIDGIKGSIDIVKKNFVQVLLTWLIIGAIAVVGALLCGVGLLVAGPVASLFLVYAYRRLTGGQIAPLTT